MTERRWIIHPPLLAVFPSLFLYSGNADKFPVGVFLVPALKAAAAVAAAWFVLGAILKDARRSAAVVSLFTVLFSSHGHVSRLLGTDWRVALAALGAAFIAGAYLILRTKSDLGRLTAGVNAAALTLVLTAGLPALARIGRPESAAPSAVAGPVAVGADADAASPDIYYIILDGYGAPGTLLDLYGHDARGFVKFLKGNGFVVAEKSRANYSHTALSLASSLNFSYLDSVARAVGADSTDQSVLRRMIARSRVREVFSKLGYRFVAFSTGYQATDIRDADRFLEAERSDEFSEALRATTALAGAKRRREAYRRRFMFTLDRLPEAAEGAGPAFVFAHILSPHPPFLFTAEGKEQTGVPYSADDSADHLIRPGRLTRAQYVRFYAEQAAFVEAEIQRALKAVLARPGVRPIIILQGDHGPGAFLRHDDLSATYLLDRMSIFNAYLLPGEAAGSLYESISPVNTFRLVLNGAFGAKLALLKDRSFFAPISRPYDFTDVTSAIGSAEDAARLERLRAADF